MNFNIYDDRYPSRRELCYGRRGMVATGHQLASQAGLEILKKGGNAIDAAIAMAISLTVVEPTANGLGSDAFALVWAGGKLHGLNASGWSGSLCDAEKLKAQGHEKMPDYGIQTVTVPGAVSAWKELSEKFGKLPMAELFAPAIDYAENGFPVSPVAAEMWRRAYNKYKDLHGDDPQYKAWFDTFAPKGRAPYPGELFKNPDQAKTLRELAATCCESYYKGGIADKIIAFSDELGGNLIKADLEEYKPDWVQPIHVDYKGYQVWEIPPNGHGIIALMTLNMIKGFEFEQRESGECYHKCIEALKLAFADGKRYVTDPRFMSVSTDELLSEEYAAERRALIGEEALQPFHGNPKKGGTVYLCTADGEGNMVSFIQSNYWGFGSGLVVPGTGISLQNRGREFSLDAENDNYLLPRKKPYHTIIPGFITKDGVAVGPFGVMGGYMQPQGHAQVVQSMVDFAMNPQMALNAPRWQWTGDKTVLLEKSVAPEILEELLRRGHDASYAPESYSFGRGQIILRTEDGGLVGGTEPRTDSAILGY